MIIKQQRPTDTQQLLYHVALAITISISALNVIALGLLVSTPSSDNVFFVSLLSLLAMLMWVALLAAKQGHQAGDIMIVGLPLLASTLSGILLADSSITICFTFTIPLVLASMMWKPKHVIAVFVLCLMLGITIIFLDVYDLSSVIVPHDVWHLTDGITTLLTISLVTFFSIRWQQTLRGAQRAAEIYARDLENTQHELRQRQRELEATQNILDQHNKNLQQTLLTVGELGVGIIPLAPGVLVVPVHGDVTLDMAHSLRARLIAACMYQRAHMVVLDMPDAQLRLSAARVLAQTLESVAALEVVVVVSGITEALEPLSPHIHKAVSLADVVRSLEEDW